MKLSQRVLKRCVRERLYRDINKKLHTQPETHTQNREMCIKRLYMRPITHKKEYDLGQCRGVTGHT